MPELLLEIHCEEIPARMQKRAGQDLQKMLIVGLEKAGLTVGEPRHFVGPRRLVFIADIPLRSPDVSEERKGPRVDAPEKAIEGFMRGAGLSDISQAEVRNDSKKGDFYVAVMTSEGRDSAAIIAELVPEVMGKFPWPKSMKSGSSNFRWVRPLTSILCILDGKTVAFEVGGIASGNTTAGHRRMAEKDFSRQSFTSVKQYTDLMEEQGKVMLDGDMREQTILSQAREICAANGLELVEDAGLLEEVSGLTEWPVVLLGDMDESFLELPEEVIRLTLKSHQKTFTVRDKKTGKLAPHFIIVANQIAPDGGEEIKRGNAKVISARLSDAQFFQAEDAKKNLIDYFPKLADVVFHEKLGTMADKADRVAALARELAPICGADPDVAEEAAKLAKCDLVTQTVIEFTSLQGQIGRLMYERENNLVPGLRTGTSQPHETPDQVRGQAHSIATAIEDHYKPQGPSDRVPTDPVAVTVALADKIDTLVGFWAINEKPTGSKDPYALRRAALGVVRIILENGVRFNLVHPIVVSFPKLIADILGSEATRRIESLVPALLSDALTMSDFLERRDKVLGDFLSDDQKTGDHQIRKIISTTDSLIAFIIDRLKVYLRDQDIRHDLIDAVFVLGEDDLVAIVNRVKALQAFIETEDGANLLAGYKRAANILRAEEKKDALPNLSVAINADLLSQAEEQNLYAALTKAKADIDQELASESYESAMTALSKLRGPIDAFFDSLMVNDEDTKIRENRLRLLGMIRDTARAIAEFDAIEG